MTDAEQLIYMECAGLMCSSCARGDVPKWMIVFQGYTHVWKIGNGHTLCAAGPIWARLNEITE